MEFIAGEFGSKRQRDLGKFDRKGQDIHAVELAGRDAAHDDLACGLTAAELVLFGGDCRFEAAHFAVGDVEEVSAAAGGVQDADRLQASFERGEFFECVGLGKCHREGIDDGRLHDAHDVGLSRVVRAHGVAFASVHGVLEDGSKDVGRDVGPVVRGGFFEHRHFGVGIKLDRCGLREDAAVEILDAFVPSACDAASLIHGAEKSIEQVESLGGCCAFFQQVGEERSRE